MDARPRRGRRAAGLYSSAVSLWLISVVVSWLAAAGTVALICRIPRVIVYVPPDWRVVAAAAALAHVIACALVFAPLVRALQARRARPATCVVTALAGVLPWSAVLVWRAQGLDGAVAAARTPEGLLTGAFFVIAAGAFGLVRHERDPRLAALERRLAEAERRLAGRAAV